MASNLADRTTIDRAERRSGVAPAQRSVSPGEELPDGSVSESPTVARFPNDFNVWLLGLTSQVPASRVTSGQPPIAGESAPAGDPAKMSRKKISTTIYITPEQNDRLKLLHEWSKVPIAVYIREGIDMVLKQYDHMLPGQMSLEAAGQKKS